MSDDLLSLRALVVSRDGDLGDLFRQASSLVSIPVEVLEAADAAAGCRLLSGDTDLAFLDSALPATEIAQMVGVARAAAQPPFTALLASAAAQAFETDGLAGKPSRPQEATWLLERSMRVRLRSRVLVVDDSPTMRTIVRKALAGTRFPLDVTEADEGLAALQLVRENDFNIVFLDHNMPGFSGLETLSEFKREKRRVVVVLMTSAEDTEVAERAREHGAAFLKKPFFPADIEAVLSGFYGLRALNPKRA
jgi:CheY-like chemotaxis protein